MTTYCESDKKLNVARGIALARHAYNQRTGQRAPPLVKAHFERNGDVLETYDALQLANGGVVPKEGGAPTQQSSTK